MNPNPQVYGAPETWTYSYINGGLETDAAKALKIQKAKVPRWDYDPDNAGYWNSQLRSGITEEKLTKNVPIDKTICAVGMGRDCPFAEMGYFRRVVREGVAGDVGLDSIVRVGNGVVNGFLWEMRANSGTSGNYNLLSAGGGQIDEKQMTYRTWAPSSDNILNSANQNGNYFVAPYTFYQLKTFIASIQVYVCNSADIPDDPADITQVPSATWRSLDSWKNDYSTHKIIGLRVVFARANQILDSGGRFTYTRPSPPSAYSYSVPCGFGVLDELSFDSESQYKVYDYALFADGSSWQTVIFRPFTDTVWSSSIHRIAFFGMYNVFSTYLRYLSGAVWYQIPYSEENYEAICRAVATFGFIFVTDGTLTLPSAMNTDNICFPVINDEGIAHGDYTRGADNLNNDLYNLDSTRNKNYDPKVPVDDNTYSNITGFNYITEGAAMTVRYVLDGANVDKLLSDLWTINASIAQGGDFEYFDGKIKNEYLTTNPIDCIVSLIRYPFNIPYQLQPLQTYVKLGKTAGSAKGWTTVYISNQINFQGINIFPRFGDCFLDYEPYTTYELYVPFCGTTKIRAADILGHTLNVSMLIDLITGSCTAYVKADQLVIETLQGSCGVQQQISGTDTATMNANIYNGILAQKQAKTGVIAQAASALLPSNWVNPVGYAAKGEQAETSYKQATFAIEHIETPVHSQGAASPLLGWIQEFDARLMIYYPEGDVIDGAIPPSFKPAPLAAFGHLKGFATVTPGAVGAFRSSNAAFISGDIIADDIPCTLSERNRIKSMFADGVYLPPL